jgi:hypothetical protein
MSDPIVVRVRLDLLCTTERRTVPKTHALTLWRPPTGVLLPVSPSTRSDGVSEASKACTACISLVTRAGEPSECASRASCDRTRDWPALSKGWVCREKQTVIVRLSDGAAIGVLASTLARHSRFFATLLTSPGWYKAARGEIALTRVCGSCSRGRRRWTACPSGWQRRVCSQHRWSWRRRRRRTTWALSRLRTLRCASSRAPSTRPMRRRCYCSLARSAQRVSRSEAHAS